MPAVSLDPYEARAERFLALVLLAMVAATSREGTGRQSNSGPSPAATGTPSGAALARRRGVRPPRSC